jgi:hypothetical protein
MDPRESKWGSLSISRRSSAQHLLQIVFRGCPLLLLHRRLL